MRGIVSCEQHIVSYILRERYSHYFSQQDFYLQEGGENMMDLESAIQHCEEVANTNERLCETVHPAMQLSDYGKCAEDHRQLAEWLKELKAYKEQGDDEELDFVPEHKKIPCTMIIGKSCGDAISRQATVERLCRVADFMNEKRKGLGSPYIMAALFIQDNKDEFPPVTPQQRPGRWITLKDEYGDVVEAVCSCCDENGNHKWAFCPHCGCKMQEVIE